MGDNREYAEINGIKWGWLERQLEARMQDFSELVELDVLCMTWNVNGRLPQTDDLAAMLAEGGDGADMVFVGLQEVYAADEGAGIIQYPTANDPRELAWIGALTSVLCPSAEHAKYRLVAAERLAGVMLVAFSRGGLELDSRVVRGQVGCGLLGWMGNKGGVAIRLRAFDEWITVVNAHLAAGQDSAMKRNQDYHEIRSRLLLPVIGRLPEEGGSVSQRVFDLLRERPVGPGLEASDTVIWMGDLNYRTDLPADYAKRLVDGGKLEQLLEYDQLLRERDSSRTLDGYVEPRIRFRPSYKFDAGTDTYDTSEKNRTPSYCDRIMYRANDARVTCTKYTSVPGVRTSDHKPVLARLRVRLQRLDYRLFEGVFEEAVRSLDLFENSQIPVTEVAPGEEILDFGLVRYRRLVTRSFTLRNIGQTAAEFAFTRGPGGAAVFKPWLRASPARGLLLPGESVGISVHVYPSGSAAVALNYDADRIAGTVLILRVDGGRDHFLAVEGIFKQSLFARRLVDACQPSTDNPFVVHVPVPLRRLCEYLHRQAGLKAEGLFLACGDRSLVGQVIDCIDDDREFPGECAFPVGLLSVAECIVRYLESLPEPVIGAETRERLIRHCDDPRALDTIIRELATANFVVFDYLCDAIGCVPDANPTVPMADLAWVVGEAVARLSGVEGSDREREGRLMVAIGHFLRGAKKTFSPLPSSDTSSPRVKF